MSISDLLQLPTTYAQIEHTFFSREKSELLIMLYNSMYNANLEKKDKITNIKKILDMFYLSDENCKKLLCLVMFSVLNTSFGISLIQENEKFRQVVFDKYQEFIGLSDQDFVEALKIRKI